MTAASPRRWRDLILTAGSKPAGRVHPGAIALLTREGYTVDGLRSKSWDEFATPNAPKLDAVITVRGNAAAEECPYRPGAPVRAHWGVEDPAAAEADWTSAFQTAYDILETHARGALAEPIETMHKDALEVLLAKIGTTL